METDTPAAPEPGSLEAAISAGLETATSPNPAGDLLSDFAAELTQDLPVQKPGDPPPVSTDEPEPEPAVTDEPEPEPAKTDDEEIPEPPQNASKKARESWDQLRARGDRYKQESTSKDTVIAEKDGRITTLEAENAELRSKAAKVPEYEEKLKAFDEYEAELSVTRIEATQEYKKAIVEPFKVLDNAIDTLVKSNEGTDSDAVLRMVQESDLAKQRAAFKELTAGWDEVDRGELWGMVKDARVLFDKQDQMRSNAAAAAKEREEMAGKAEAARKEAAQREFKTASTDAVKSLREKIPFIPIADGETEEDRFTRLADRLTSVDFDSQTPRGKAFAAAAALELPNLIKSIAKLKAENAELIERIGKANKAKPSTGTPKVEAPAAAGDDDNLFDIAAPASRLSHSIPVVAAD